MVAASLHRQQKFSPPEIELRRRTIATLFDWIVRRCYIKFQNCFHEDFHLYFFRVFLEKEKKKTYI